jgi:hypothetical protein
MGLIRDFTPRWSYSIMLLMCFDDCSRVSFQPSSSRPSSGWRQSHGLEPQNARPVCPPPRRRRDGAAGDRILVKELEEKDLLDARPERRACDSIPSFTRCIVLDPNHQHGESGARSFRVSFGGLAAIDDGHSFPLGFQPPPLKTHVSGYFSHSVSAPCIEVDLRPHVGKALTLEELANEICDSPANREWLHHPEATALERQLMAELHALRPTPAPAPAPFRGAGPPVYMRTGTDLSMLDAERLAIRKEHGRHRALTSEQKLAELQAAVGAPPDAWPDLFTTVKLNSRPAINAPAPLWQGALFQEFVLGTLGDARRRDYGFSAAAVNAWTWARFDTSPGESMTGIISEVLRFLEHLVAKGYLRFSGDKYFVVRDSLPPRGG